MPVFVLGNKNHVATQFENEVVSKEHTQTFRSGTLILNTDSPYYPKRGDEKIMRQDTKAAIVLINELLEEFGEGLERDEMGLYVASGVFIENFEKHLGHLVSVFEHIKDAKNEAEKLQNIYRASPPLLALQTLTNSTMSFIAQYTGIQGNNATFGTSSSAGFNAILEGMHEVLFNQNPTLVAASNVAGVYSYLTNSNLYQSTQNWFESAAVGGLLLSSQPTENTLCKINTRLLGNITPQLHSRKIDYEWLKTQPVFSSDALIFSGAYTTDIHKIDLDFYSKHHVNALSFFGKMGNAGPVNLFISIDEGIRLISEGAKKIDLIDRDIYGRYTHLQLEAVS